MVGARQINTPKLGRESPRERTAHRRPADLGNLHVLRTGHAARRHSPVWTAVLNRQAALPGLGRRQHRERVGHLGVATVDDLLIDQ